MPDGQQHGILDGQTDFSGGMRDNVSPERLGLTEYAFGESIELRDGFPTTRRGSFRLLEDNSTFDFQGAFIFKNNITDEEHIFVAQDSKLFRIDESLDRTLLKLPASIGTGRVNFVQALNNLYLFCGDKAVPLKWETI